MNSKESPCFIGSIRLRKRQWRVIFTFDLVNDCDLVKFEIWPVDRQFTLSWILLANAWFREQSSPNTGIGLPMKTHRCEQSNKITPFTFSVLSSSIYKYLKLLSIFICKIEGALIKIETLINPLIIEKHTFLSYCNPHIVQIFELDHLKMEWQLLLWNCQSYLLNKVQNSYIELEYPFSVKFYNFIAVADQISIIFTAGWILLLSMWMCSKRFCKLLRPYKWKEAYVICGYLTLFICYM